ncbi:uncharacterized protein A4U43_C03F16680 [Asparagus officinalis]|uniref:DUF295 domain-containing protein n=1 Tax=Asparagus officinalis TaxID=4686 RepID=A0A5P1FB70_ASPOF|nr:F-box protein SKIP23-like [Asparagus officinalis]ONK75422.1 uncharacterized protein A4U43_C03F16680 [Asparagus officinalis]
MGVSELRPSSEPVPSSPDWANLFPEVLTLIAKRLSAADYARFSAVCTSWASVASPENGMPGPLALRRGQPYLLFSGDGVGDCEQSDFCTLFDFLDDSFRRIRPLPEIRGKWLVGSQFGWLAVVDELANPSLLNPFTRTQIELPPITTVPDVDPVYDSEGSLVGYNREEEYYPLELCRVPLVISKIVLSSAPTAGDFGAVAIGPSGLLMFARPGERKWNLWDICRLYAVVDVIYRDGVFLAVNNMGDVYAIDLASPSSSLKVSLVAKGYGDYHDTRYLLDSSGVLLHILCKRIPPGELRYRTCKIEIRSLDPETSTWLPVTSLGDRSLFIGSWCSMSLQAGEISWLKENRVYFTEDFWAVLPFSKEVVRDIGMFNLNTGNFEACYPPEMRLKWPPPIWITAPQF